MKKYIFIAAYSFIFIGCNKNSDEVPRVINTNKITARVTVLDRPSREFVASGNDSTIFFKSLYTYPDRVDTIIIMRGLDALGYLELALFNITSPGTYPFPSADITDTNVSMGYYNEGYSPTMLFSTVGSDTTGTPYASGSYTITKLENDGEIEGYFNTTMKSEQGEVVIENGVFKGKLQF